VLVVFVVWYGCSAFKWFLNKVRSCQNRMEKRHCRPSSDRSETDVVVTAVTKRKRGASNAPSKFYVLTIATKSTSLTGFSRWAQGVKRGLILAGIEIVNRAGKTRASTLLY